VAEDYPKDLYRGDAKRTANSPADEVKLVFNGFQPTKAKGRKAAEVGDSTDTKARRTPTASTKAQQAAT
jgi:hypothetical protein